jgi:hypothetical protein
MMIGSRAALRDENRPMTSYFGFLSLQQKCFLGLVGWAVIVRLTFLGAGVYTSVVFPAATHDSQEYVAIAIPTAATILAVVRDLHRSSDEGWYYSVAANGYTERPFDLSRQENWCISPLMPMLWRLVGLRVFILILLIYAANLCSLYFLWRYCLDELQLGFRRSQLACLCFVFWPFGYQLFCTRAEPFLVMLTFAGFYYYWKGAGWRGFGLVLLCSFLATAAKPNGFLTGAALIGTEILIQLRDRRYQWPSAATWIRLALMSAATFVPLVLLSIVMQTKTGNPFAWVDIQATWAMPSRPSLESIVAAYLPKGVVTRWGWEETLPDSALLYFSLAVLLLFALRKWRVETYWPLLVESGLIQVVSGAWIFAYVFNRHSLPILLNYVAAGSSRRTAYLCITIGAAFQALSGALAALHVMHVLT